ncbi:hypothetical protein GCM10010269_47710 [Streptomyces humidus]|uniref:DUF7144 domain-containing protein n=1 Tax=Streptomyces humidus TaxID=52259 RepID=A0A918L5C2_9ACTN|nr:hypothetical protein [Streptomyces humidus]GGS03258.1 hypothetical protein GCM10010269_47710 [Streptomyces humidus]
MSPTSPAGDPHGEIGTAWSVPRGGPRRPDPPDGRTGGQTGGHIGGRPGDGVVFAGVLMLCSGILAVLQGVAAVAADDVYARVGSYVYALSLTGWGWIHLVLGAVAAATGAALLKGVVRARYPGVFLAALSLVAQFLFLPYEPLWSITVMAVDVFVIRSLTSWPERAA